jgi:hypothetical protein
MQKMTQPQSDHSIMYRDFERKVPMEVETFLGAPLKLALEHNIAVPRIETLYAMLHHINIVNRTRPTPPTPQVGNGEPQSRPPPPRLSSAPLPRQGPGGPMMNGNGPMKGGPRPGSRAPSINGGPPPMMRRGPPSGPANGMNGYPPRQMVNGNGYPPMPNGQRRGSFDENNLEEFSHLMLYENMAEDGGAGSVPNGNYDPTRASSNDLALRERELMLRQKELALREQELNMRRGPRARPPPPPSQMGGFDDDDDEDDYFDPSSIGPPPPMIDPDNFDMMSVTSRRNRKIPSASQIRKNPELMGMGPGGQPRQSRNPFSRPGANKNRTSARMMQDVPGLHDSIMNSSLLGLSSNRYANVDRGALEQQSRANSLTAARLDEFASGAGYGAYPMSRRTSQSPGNPLSPGPRPSGRPSPPNGYAPNGMVSNGRPSPPGMKQPVPRHPPGHGNAVTPQQVEQHAGVSNLNPPKFRTQVRSLTGSASASTESGNSAQLDSETSAHSSQSSLAVRPPVAQASVR